MKSTPETNLFGFASLFEDLQNLAFKHFKENKSDELVSKLMQAMQHVKEIVPMGAMIEGHPSTLVKNLPVESEGSTLSFSGLKSILESTPSFDWDGYQEGYLYLRRKYKESPLENLAPKGSVITPRIATKMALPRPLNYPRL